MPTDHYQVLGVPKDASADDIKRAYRRLARQYHPDVSHESSDQEMFKAVSNAYEVLSDPRKREMYDLGGDPLRSSGPDAGPGGMSGDGFTFTDIFDAFFGQTGQRGPRSRTRRGQDALLRVASRCPSSRTASGRTPSGWTTLRRTNPCWRASGSTRRKVWCS